MVSFREYIGFNKFDANLLINHFCKKITSVRKNHKE